MEPDTQTIVETFRKHLEGFKDSRERMARKLNKLFKALEENKIKTNVSTDALLMDLTQRERMMANTGARLVELMEKTSTLANSAALMTSSLDFEQVLDQVMDNMIDLTNAERAYLMLRDSGAETFSVMTARNRLHETLHDEEIVFSRGVINKAIDKQEAVIVYDASEDTQLGATVQLKKLRSILCIPLVLRDEVVGVMYADHTQQQGVFEQDTVPMLTAFGIHAAVAIENARLYHELEQVNVQLTEANRLKSEFLGVISHELRSPFVSIGMALETFPRYGMENLASEQVEVWDELKDGVKKAERLVNNLVNYAGLLSKQGQLELGPVDIPEMIRTTIFAAGRMARTRGIELALDLPDELILPRGDVDRLSEAVWHLVQNAIENTPAGGKIIVRAVELVEHLVIEVEDTGSGIPEEHQDRIWGAFEQISDAVKRGVEGLGLGLAIVRFVAKAHGGSVTLQSESGEGSTFAIVLPLPTARLAAALVSDNITDFDGLDD